MSAWPTNTAPLSETPTGERMPWTPPLTNTPQADCASRDANKNDAEAENGALGPITLLVNGVKNLLGLNSNNSKPDTFDFTEQAKRANNNQ